jgi:predicted nucleotidyltransferase
MKDTAATRTLAQAAAALGELKDEVVFIGGAVVDLLLSDPASPPQRATEDVDVILTQVKTLTDYYAVEEKLRHAGFHQKPIDGVLCRWHGHGFRFDIMPVDDAGTGSVNPWYQSAVDNAEEHVLPGGLTVEVIDPPHFLATKLVAFQDRGMADIFASHDLEDIVGVINGRETISEEVSDAPKELRDYVAESLRELIGLRSSKEAIEGHLGATDSSLDRRDVVLARIEIIAAIG